MIWNTIHVHVYSFIFQNPSCSLCSVALSRCGINSAGMTELQKGLTVNQSLTEFNLNGSEVTCWGRLFEINDVIS